MHRSFFSHFFEIECGGRSNEVPEGLTLKMQHVNCQEHPSKICELRYFLQKDGWWATIICLFFHTILYYTILYYTILYYTILYYTIHILYYAILYFTVLYYTILYYTILYYTILYYTILYYTIQY